MAGYFSGVSVVVWDGFEGSSGEREDGIFLGVGGLLGYWSGFSVSTEGV